MGRDEPKRRRACLYAVIEEMTAAEPQGFLKDDANIERLCVLAGVSRAGFYRRRGPNPPAREETDLRDLIQRIALTDRHYGYRRIAVELRRQGLIVNAKRVLRLMGADNLLSLRAKPFIPRTTISGRRRKTEARAGSLDWAQTQNSLGSCAYDNRSTRARNGAAFRRSPKLPNVRVSLR